MINMEIISTNLKRLRKEHDLTCDDLAKVLGITRQAYNNYELKTKQPSLNSLLRLSSYYNISLDELVGNPCTVGRQKALDFITYEIDSSEINIIDKVIISSEQDTNFIVKDPKKNIIYVFGTSSFDIPGTVMLFSLNNKKYISELIECDNHYIFFDHNSKPVIITKKDYKDIVFAGTLLFEVRPKYDYFTAK